MSNRVSDRVKSLEAILDAIAYAGEDFPEDEFNEYRSLTPSGAPLALLERQREGKERRLIIEVLVDALGARRKHRDASNPTDVLLALVVLKLYGLATPETIKEVLPWA